MPRPPEKEDKLRTWPDWPMKMRTSSSQAEGAVRDWSVVTARLRGSNGRVEAIECARMGEGMKPIAGTEFELKADLVLLAMGFVHPVHEGMLEELAVERDQRGNVKADTEAYATSLDKVFSAGDMRRGQSLVVWAIREGRQAAHAVDHYLMGSTELPR
jgi:glutamate synthase (NADPH/NADH) small chain